MARTSSATTARPIVRELAGQAQRLDVVFDARTAYDFLIAIEAHGEKEHENDLLAQDAAWRERASESLSPEVKGQHRRLLWRALAGPALLAAGDGR